jgi:hypothetical protein
LAQLAALGTNRFVFGRPVDRPLLDKLRMHRIANLDCLILQRIQPAHAPGFIDFAQFFAQLSSKGRDPFFHPIGSCHP